jgi:hypothetical protein
VEKIPLGFSEWESSNINVMIFGLTFSKQSAGRQIIVAMERLVNGISFLFLFHKTFYQIQQSPSSKVYNFISFLNNL